MKYNTDSMVFAMGLTEKNVYSARGWCLWL